MPALEAAPLPELAAAPVTPVLLSWLAPDAPPDALPRPIEGNIAFCAP